MKFVSLLAASVALGAFVATAHADNDNSYRSTVLVANLQEDAPLADPLLVNAWGIAASPTSPWWVSDEATDFSTLYTGVGVKVPLEVEVAGGPTGIVWNGGSAFEVAPGFPARFIFATGSGTFLGWNPQVDPTHAVEKFSDPGSIYLGLAIHGDTLYTTDFTECEVEAFDGDWEESEEIEFEDDTIPAGYCPFGIQAIGDSIFVSYALSGGEEEIAGIGRGVVREFDLEGHLIAEVGSHGRLNAPWGIAMAPDDFGKFSGCLLVGNFGDGRINAFCKDDEGEWHPAGRLREGRKDLVVEGLWGLGFGNGAGSGPTNVLYFAAGPEEETEGYFGKIELVQ